MKNVSKIVLMTGLLTAANFQLKADIASKCLAGGAFAGGCTGYKIAEPHVDFEKKPLTSATVIITCVGVGAGLGSMPAFVAGNAIEQILEKNARAVEKAALKLKAGIVASMGAGFFYQIYRENFAPTDNGK
jgi:hypothetical protein